jgi:hypothetical protein
VKDEVTVNVNVLVANPDALVAVIVYVVGLCLDVGVPVSNPVEELNVVPAGAAGEMAKLEIAPPVDVMVYPEIALFTVFVSATDERANAGAAIVGFPFEVDSGGT